MLRTPYATVTFEIYEDHVGMLPAYGLMTVRNALFGIGLRDAIKLNTNSKIVGDVDIGKRIIKRADYNQLRTRNDDDSQLHPGAGAPCHECPVGIATSRTTSARAL